MRRVIARRIQSQNKSHYAHWSKVHAEKNAWKLLLRQAFGIHPEPCAVPVAMAIISYRARLLDYANLVGGAKPIPDCLIELGWIKDDSPKWFSCKYRQVQVKRCDECTVIILRNNIKNGGR